MWAYIKGAGLFRLVLAAQHNTRCLAPWSCIPQTPGVAGLPKAPVISTGRSVKLKGPVTSRVAWALALSTTRPCDAAKDLHSPALDNQAQGRPSSPMGPTMRQVSTTGPRPAPSWRQAGRFPLKWTLGRRLPLCATARRRLPLRAWHVNTTPPTMATSPQGGLLADGQQRWRRQPGDGQVQQARRAPVRLQLPCLVVCLSHQ